MAEKLLKQMAKVFESYRYAHGVYTVFEDFLELAAIEISNPVDLAQKKKRDERYVEIVKKYNEKEFESFGNLLGMLIMAMGKEPDDYLGRLFMELELFDHFRGQFFTPINIAMLMAKMHDTNIEKILSEKGRVTVNDPTCGSAVTLIAFYKILQERGYNPQKVMRVVAQDIDKKAVHMAYIQLSLLGVNAQVLQGDTLSLKFSDVWRSPGYFFEWGYGDFKRENNDLEVSDKVQELVIEDTESMQLSLF